MFVHTSKSPEGNIRHGLHKAIQDPRARVAAVIAESVSITLFYSCVARAPTRPQNMIGQSQSGTGKMVAFVLTMLNRIDFSKNKTQVRGMILVARLAILDVDPLTRPSV
jgi:hypothetical protein